MIKILNKTFLGKTKLFQLIVREYIISKGNNMNRLKIKEDRIYKLIHNLCKIFPRDRYDEMIIQTDKGEVTITIYIFGDKCELRYIGNNKKYIFHIECEKIKILKNYMFSQYYISTYNIKFSFPERFNINEIYNSIIELENIVINKYKELDKDFEDYKIRKNINHNKLKNMLGL